MFKILIFSEVMSNMDFVFVSTRYSTTVHFAHGTPAVALAIVQGSVQCSAYMEGQSGKK